MKRSSSVYQPISPFCKDVRAGNDTAGGGFMRSLCSSLAYDVVKDELRQTSFGLSPKNGVMLSLVTHCLHRFTPVNMMEMIYFLW